MIRRLFLSDMTDINGVGRKLIKHFAIRKEKKHIFAPY